MVDCGSTTALKRVACCELHCHNGDGNDDVDSPPIEEKMAQTITMLAKKAIAKQNCGLGLDWS